jgi:stearoyl-CoA desaturase (delta-9 desaturase)
MQGVTFAEARPGLVPRSRSAVLTAPAPPAAAPTDPEQLGSERFNWRTSAPFLLLHLVPLLAIFTGVTRRAVVIFVVLYAVRMFAITAGYHRCFAHRSYRASRPVRFVLAVLGSTAVQKGPIWWASHHREHHRYVDTELDPHTPQRGFWWSHVGWILCDRYSGTDESIVADLTCHRELRLVDRFDAVAPWTLALLTFVVGGWSGLVVGFFGSTIVLWHATFSINSLSHLYGSRRFATNDTSRNNVALALITFGEGWHNNHHHHASSARQGFYWWELDLSWLALRALASVGLVHDLRQPTPAVLARNRVAPVESRRL